MAFRCPVCLEHFLNLNDLQEHTGTNDPSCSKPYICESCNKWFCHRSACDEHRHVEHDCRKFPCAFCTRVFGTTQARAQHLASAHGGFVAQHVERSISPPTTYANDPWAHKCESDEQLQADPVKNNTAREVESDMTSQLLHAESPQLLDEKDEVDLDDMPFFTMVDSESAMVNMMCTLVDLPVSPPSIYIDLEGISLSRHGSISLLQLYIPPIDNTYVVDVHQLQAKAFTTIGYNSPSSLKDILEDNDTPKVFFDVRHDSDALFHHFHIRLAGIYDIQLMEIATRPSVGTRLKGLKKCLELHSGISPEDLTLWNATKDAGIELYEPGKGGRYEIFNQRPLSKDLIRYCVQDVRFLPRLWTYYDRNIDDDWADRVRLETQERVEASQREDYNGQGEHMTLVPASWRTLPRARRGRFDRRGDHKTRQEENERQQKRKRDDEESEGRKHARSMVVEAD